MSGRDIYAYKIHLAVEVGPGSAAAADGDRHLTVAAQKCGLLSEQYCFFDFFWGVGFIVFLPLRIC